MSGTGHGNGGALKLDRDKLIRAREMLGYGIETTAGAAGVSKNSVLRAEHEEDIRPVTARKIAAALEVEVRDLLPLGQAPLPNFEERRKPVEISAGFSGRSSMDADLEVEKVLRAFKRDEITEEEAVALLQLRHDAA